MSNACCKRGVPPSNTAQDGEAWTCPKCGTKWIHICDEADGCCWERDIEFEAIASSTRAALLKGLEIGRARRGGTPSRGDDEVRRCNRKWNDPDAQHDCVLAKGHRRHHWCPCGSWKRIKRRAPRLPPETTKGSK